MPKKPTKAVVFDLDETLGHFTQLGLVWDAIENAHDEDNKTTPHFSDVMDAFPEYQRPGIIKILRYLVGKKQTGSCNTVMIYTNNQGPRSWALQIQNYFEDKIGCSIFDKVIAAFKVNGERIELKRTSHDKTVSDLISCTRIPSDTQICFIDDQHHPRMEHDNVYYIHIKPYVCTIPYRTIGQRLQSGSLLERLSAEKRGELVRSIERLSRRYPDDDIELDEDEQDVDAIVGKRILQHIQEFFKMYGNRYTRRKRDSNRHRSRTRKNITSSQ